MTFFYDLEAFKVYFIHKLQNHQYYYIQIYHMSQFCKSWPNFRVKISIIFHGNWVQVFENCIQNIWHLVAAMSVNVTFHIYKYNYTLTINMTAI